MPLGFLSRNQEGLFFVFTFTVSNLKQVEKPIINLSAILDCNFHNVSPLPINGVMFVMLGGIGGCLR